MKLLFWLCLIFIIVMLGPLLIPLAFFVMGAVPLTLLFLIAYFISL
jgi:hypothetical protein